MIIQSSFTDYYDYVRKTGVDKTLSYKRETVILDKRPIWHHKYYPNLMGRYRDRKWVDTDPLSLIEFCGKLYYFANTPAGIDYNKEAWEPLLQAERKRRAWDLGHWYKPPSKRYKSDAPIIVLLTEQQLRDGEIYHRTVAYANPCLSDYSFGKVVSPEKAYQELMMWFANKKLPPPIPHVDDKTMAEAKGFDKHSFRNFPK